MLKTDIKSLMDDSQNVMKQKSLSKMTLFNSLIAIKKRKILKSQALLPLSLPMETAKLLSSN